MKAKYSSYGFYSSSSGERSYSIEFETDDADLLEMVKNCCKHAVDIARKRNEDDTYKRVKDLAKMHTDDVFLEVTCENETDQD